MKIISGGQTGADRAALDFAIKHGIDHGGWCPNGRRAEDGPIPPQYNLRETEEADYAVRTERNVCDADATVVFTTGQTVRGGTALTIRLAHKHNKPLLHLWGTGDEQSLADRLEEFLLEHNVWTINVAGPRASQDSAAGDFVVRVLNRWFQSTATTE